MIYLTLVVPLLITMAAPRLITRQFQSVNLRQQKSWIYLDRMHCGAGQVTVQFWMYLRTQNVPSLNKYKISLEAVPDYMWQQQIQRRCASTSQSTLSTQMYNTNQPKPKRQTIILTLNHQNSLTNKSTLSFNLVEPTTYYFILTDCDKSMVNQYFNKKSKFDIQVDIKNNGNNYGSDQAMYTWMIPLMIAICAVLIHMLNNSNNTSNDFQDINWPIIIFKIIVWAHVVGLFFFYFGHVIYVLGRGKDFAFFSFVFLIVSTFSQAMMLILITFCAYGWMTTYRVSDNQEVYYPLSTVAGFLSLVLALLSKISDGEPQKTHIYDSVPSYIQIILKSICFCVFLVGIVLSYTKFIKNGPLLIYIRKLAIFGVLCFASVPFVILCSSYMSKHTRWVSVFVSTQLLRTLQVAIIGYQILDKKSTYNKLTLHGKSFMEHDNKYL